MKQHVRPQLERISAAIGRHIPRFGQIADHLRVVGRVELEQGRVMRRDRVQDGKGNICVAIVVVRLDEDRKFERATALGAGFGGGARDAGEEPG